MREIDLQAWRKEGLELFGKDPLKWRFVCPKCGRKNIAEEFAHAGVPKEEAPNAAAQNCIGRHNPSEGCNWAAYGLFGTMGKGVQVNFPDGHSSEAFEYDKGGSQS